MITVYRREDGLLRQGTLAADGTLPADCIWIDLLNPTADEEHRIEAMFDIDAPTREEMQEIEASSRFYQEADATYMTVVVTAKADTTAPESTAITFIRTPKLLVTKRYAEPQPFRTFVARASRQGGLAGNGDTVMIGLLDAVIDRAADILERVGNELDTRSRAVFHASASVNLSNKEHTATDLEDVIRQLGRAVDLTSKVQQSVLSVARLLTYLTQALAEGKQNKDLRARMKVQVRDAHSLTEHAAQLAQKSSFLLDATLGLINIQQTAIIKIFSVAAVVFLPPTLVASIYGMNFAHIPELHWAYGYFWGLGIMVLSAVLPYWFFKQRGWL